VRAICASLKHCSCNQQEAINVIIEKPEAKLRRILNLAEDDVSQHTCHSIIAVTLWTAEEKQWCSLKNAAAVDTALLDAGVSLLGPHPACFSCQIEKKGGPAKATQYMFDDILLIVENRKGKKAGGIPSLEMEEHQLKRTKAIMFKTQAFLQERLGINVTPVPGEAKVYTLATRALPQNTKVRLKSRCLQGLDTSGPPNFRASKHATENAAELAEGAEGAAEGVNGLPAAAEPTTMAAAGASGDEACDDDASGSRGAESGGGGDGEASNGTGQGGSEPTAKRQKVESEGEGTPAASVAPQGGGETEACGAASERGEGSAGGEEAPEVAGEAPTATGAAEEAAAAGGGESVEEGAPAGGEEPKTEEEEEPAVEGARSAMEVDKPEEQEAAPSGEHPPAAGGTEAPPPPAPAAAEDSSDESELEDEEDV